MKIDVKLAPKLFDLFQHCELHCEASCCGWDAFDFSNRWLQRWCQFRDNQTVAIARNDIARIRNLIDDEAPNTEINIERFFQTCVSDFVERIDRVDNYLKDNED